MQKETPHDGKCVSGRGESVTSIWQEEGTPENPYLAACCRCHGYDLLELMSKRSFVDVLFLLFNGELPSPAQRRLLETLMVGCINPGPRHPATWAVMNAAVSKTDHAHLLPIGLSVLGGACGGDEVGRAMRFLRKNQQREPGQLAVELLRSVERPREGDWHLAPGFGSRFGAIDPLPRQIVDQCQKVVPDGTAIRWGSGFADAIAAHQQGWLTAGVVAAVLCDLGFDAAAGAGLYQIICAPGLLAHGVELAEKPLTAMPFLMDEERYVIAPEAKSSDD
ncbi:MAG: hypothetical protein OEV73_06555 [Desulfobulbaceae bacterium]|nr:hypothetical protein [Desulfobulbaceae bacterium]